ncbi:MAG: cyclopropane-fatty-acyl-phospholipid synthase [Gammaproteobacteria bacterium]|nr:cyclopropane-fatty-acyl-phospholipid synthase [Gammaproteobacteria bacterium]
MTVRSLGWASTAAVERALRNLRGGTLLLATAVGTAEYGAGAPTVRVTVHQADFFRRLLLRGSVGAGESYMDGEWDCDDLPALLRIMLRNRSALEGLEGLASVPAAVGDALGHRFRRNTLRGSRRNIHAHYDLGNDFFRIFLDQGMSYSCAVYDTGAESLEEASAAKLERLCRKLQLGPDDHLLDVGCGWGGLAIYAAERFGCRVTAVTVSEAQHRHARERVAACGLGERIKVLARDYRRVTGQFDKIVSVEMVEAVGHDHLDRYFAACSHLLKPSGLMALQAIVIRDSRYRRALHRADFIKKHIFPGGFIPSVSVLTRAAAKADLTLVNLEDFGLDYARTLREWRLRLDAGAHRLPAQLAPQQPSPSDNASCPSPSRPAACQQAAGSRHPKSDKLLEERFVRMWRFYFAYCEAGFAERATSDVQMLLAPGGWRGPVWRARGSA